MNTTAEIEKFNSRFIDEEISLMVLISPQSASGACNIPPDVYWTASESILAYINQDTNELTEKKGRLEWLIKNSENRLFDFKEGNIYCVIVRREKPITQSEVTPCDTFQLVDVVSELVDDIRLNKILLSYETPELYTDELSTFKLDKQFLCYEAKISWCSKPITLTLEVDNSTELADFLTRFKLKILQHASQFDTQMKAFCAGKLCELANDWQHDEIEESSTTNSVITEKSFMAQIFLKHLVIEEDGHSITAFFDDNNLFYRHSIMLHGDLDGNFTDAYIAG